LIIPKKNIAKVSDANNEDENLLGHLLLVGKKVMSDIGITDYRVVINNGSEQVKQFFTYIYIY
jgi:histidine triad (HIT) family protein